MAASKSVSRKSAAKKAGKTRKPRAAAKKASKSGKRQVARKKTAPARKKPAAAKKASSRLKTRAAVAPKAKTTVGIETQLEPRRVPEDPPAVVEIDKRIAIVRTNLRELVEQATARSGASDEELLSQRIAEQEAKLAVLRKQRDALAQSGS